MTTNSVQPTPSGNNAALLLVAGGAMLALGGIAASAIGAPEFGVPMIKVGGTMAMLGLAACGDDQTKKVPETTPPVTTTTGFCTQQTCLTSASYYCEQSNGSGMTIACEDDKVCEDGACVTPPAQTDPNCPAGQRTRPWVEKWI